MGKRKTSEILSREQQRSLTAMLSASNYYKHSNKMNTSAAYKMKWMGDDVTVVHPRGLPPSWKESNLTEEKIDAAKKAASEQCKENSSVVWLDRNLKLIKSFKII